MTKIQTFKIEKEFKNIMELHDYLINNVEEVENKIEIAIQKESLKKCPYCVMGLEAVTERKILFFASENAMPENIGELIILADTFQADIVVLIVEKINPTILAPMNWLHNICHKDVKFILGEAEQLKN